MPWQRGQSGNPRGRPVGRVSPRVRGEFALREYLEERLLEHRDAIDDTIARIVRSPRQLPRLLTLYGRLSGELQPPIALILARERQARLDEQARLWRERDALREAQWAAEDTEDMENESEVDDEPQAEPVAAPVPEPSSPPPIGGWRPVRDDERSDDEVSAIVEPPSPRRPNPVSPPMPTAQAALEQLRRERRGGSS
jgi:hypothetical protein